VVLLGALACAKEPPPAPAACSETALAAAEKNLNAELLLASSKQQQAELEALRRQVQDLARSCRAPAQREPAQPTAAKPRVVRRPSDNDPTAPAKL
jgi:hypothetical protein